MIQVSSIAEVRKYIKEMRQGGKEVGFVPTMGFLHEGHISLVEAAKAKTEIVVMSIFVNPLQFGPNEDFDRYPRDIERDSALAEAAGVDILFTPTVEEMYPKKMLTNISVAQVTEVLCGKSRPGHFDGVATVVTKLFQIVQPDYAFFGQKDAQQVAVVEQMVFDLSIPVTIVPCPIIREKDGLAKSSRNVYLSTEEREQALVLSQSLGNAKERIHQGERSAATILENILTQIKEKPLAEIDYVEVLKYPELVAESELRQGETYLIALSVKFGRTRLIDNVMVTI
ncbi:pantoate--beta-alanine ligase [Brevibacillus sp. SYSU BS000544]|uniref:pantoate--beta-alanine ligase n=1 Tax=Brevibacillus sp. SYSU BS000544 TaxID=3416443 RepID=UPI003CE52191